MKVRKILKFVLITCFFVVAACILFILTISLTDYKPEKEIVLTNMPKAAALNLDTIEILTWNIGYAGLDNNMDFFYDGGSKTRTGKYATLQNLDAITSFIADNSADFVFLQEVDRASTRSYNIDILSEITAKKPLYLAVYGINYNVLFIPVPISSPTGKVEAGILTLSRYIPSQSIRYAYPAKLSWLKKLFLLDNCFVMCRYPLTNGKQLILINTHNSAYDNGEQRREEMLVLKDFIIAEYEKGNYVIAGGDWNQIPPDENAKPYLGIATEYFTPLRIPDNLMPPTWKWISDGNPTNRFLDMPYIKGKSKETLLDFFLISPNVKAIHTERIDKNYQHSDHNPVIGKFVLSRTDYLK
ncbi:MAG: endonuclease/exonuclease/phosphatase family protein [Prevotellaceae bacterium]|jgi:endonuclease/exonuclease/phosphatase family metal-dependent hydrolase|nr:endonuclease/exonuclease/phosphatase family protein [Prevotellaceae bacterium]